ncbi:hypothetical protein H6F89_02770 [Cyanobacteria bacterium FACHB-63]|nr:hypothetical protein [Cyanobacteria bacterium FACHB-63]
MQGNSTAVFLLQLFLKLQVAQNTRSTIALDTDVKPLGEAGMPSNQMQTDFVWIAANLIRQGIPATVLFDN